MYRLNDYLKGINYPGRGVFIGATPDGVSIVVGYFIMGRSENSRNRILIPENKAIKIGIVDESKLVDSSFILYYPIRVCGNMLIVTNGDQTDTVYEYIRGGHSFEAALRTRNYEEDALLTPRISGLVDLVDGSFRLAIIQADGNSCSRYFYEYEPKPGEVRYISTYDGSNSDPKPFVGEPKAFKTIDDIDEFGASIWDALNEDNKVSFVLKYINLETKETFDRVYNRYSRE